MAPSSQSLEPPQNPGRFSMPDASKLTRPSSDFEFAKLKKHFPISKP
jgi:hypothetical protein